MHDAPPFLKKNISRSFILGRIEDRKFENYPPIFFFFFPFIESSSSILEKIKKIWQDFHEIIVCKNDRGRWIKISVSIFFHGGVGRNGFVFRGIGLFWRTTDRAMNPISFRFIRRHGIASSWVGLTDVKNAGVSTLLQRPQQLGPLFEKN